jgi:excisionase family DNA binding protein
VAGKPGDDVAPGTLNSILGGDSITVVPVGREVTTQQAADLLNVSRQYLVRLLDEGRIPFRKTGKHRRIRIEDVLAFKESRDKDRRAGLRGIEPFRQNVGGRHTTRETISELLRRRHSRAPIPSVHWVRVMKSTVSDAFSAACVSSSM